MTRRLGTRVTRGETDEREVYKNRNMTAVRPVDFSTSDADDSTSVDGKTEIVPTATPHHELLCSRWRGPCQCCFVKGRAGLAVALGTVVVGAAAVGGVWRFGTDGPVPWASLLALLALVFAPGLGPGPAGPGPFRMCGGIVFHILSLLRAYNTLEQARGPDNWQAPYYRIARISGLVLDQELLLTIVAFLQMSGDAFSDKFMWTHDHWVPKVLRLPSLDLTAVVPALFGGAAPSFWPQFLAAVLVLFGVSRLWFRGLIKGDAKTVYRANNLYAVSMIPVARVVGRVYLDCDYYGVESSVNATSSFRPDPTLSCWTSLQWWAYAVSSSWLLTLLGSACLGASNQIGRLRNSPPFPVTYDFALLFCAVKIATTWIAVALGTDHPVLSGSLTIACHAILIAYIVVRQPFCHTFFNRFNALGSVHTIISYGAALNAIRLGDATSDASVKAFGQASLVAIVVYVLIEALLHSKHRSFATSFEENYVVGSTNLQYELTDPDDPGKKVLQWPPLPGLWGGSMTKEHREAYLAAGNPAPPVAKFAGKGLGLDEDGEACHASGKPCARVVS